jgi:hypothetical protein
VVSLKEEINRLVDIIEAVAMLEHTGNFVKAGKVMGLEELSDLYLSMETNRIVSHKHLKGLLNEVRHYAEFSVYNRILSAVLQREVLEYLGARTLEERMGKRALFFAKRGQFLKAYTLIYEALITAGMKRFKLGNPDSLEERWVAFRNIKERLYINGMNKDVKVFKLVSFVRHAIVHGSQPRGELAGEVASILRDDKKLLSLVEDGYKLLQKWVVAR